MTMQSLENKVALVTGSSRGIGAAIASALARERSLSAMGPFGHRWNHSRT